MRDTLRHMVRTLVLTGLFWGLLCVGKAASEEPSHENELANIILERQTRERADYAEIPAEVRQTIIDKGRIAEEAHDRLVGLRESGNPHIRGGLRLSEIQDQPELSRVDVKQLREERIRMFRERKPPRVSKYRVVKSRRIPKSVEPDVEGPAKPREREDSDLQNGFPWLVSLFAAGLVLAVFGAVKWLEIQSRKAPS